MAWLQLRNIGVWDVLKRTVKEFGDDDMSTYAAALAYRMLFALFPFLLFLVALISVLHLSEFFDWLRQQAALLLPPPALDLVDPIIDEMQTRKTGLMSVGILLALWTASVGVRSMMNAMNIAYDVSERRPAWKLYPLSLLYTIGVAFMLLAAAGLMVVGPRVMNWLAAQVGLEQLVVTLWVWLRWPVAVLLMMLAVAVLYYVAPNVEQKFRFITPGSVVAVLVWILSSLAFGYYVQNFADYNATYGSIGAIIVLLLYFYLSAAVLLFGAELNAVIEHHAVGGKAEGEAQLPG